MAKAANPKSIKPPRHGEGHKSDRAGWLRAGVLGANDAIVSTASLMLGVAASAASKSAILIAGIAGLVAGSTSMAVGEYVSVSSQRDAEQADIESEKAELRDDPHAELRELAGIYVKRGLSQELAMQVAKQLSAKDKLRAHLRDELGIDQNALARPIQAAAVSAASFATAGLVPVLSVLFAPASLRIPMTAGFSLLALSLLGTAGGFLGGAPKGRASLRVTGGGALAMGITAAIGRLIGTSVG